MAAPHPEANPCCAVRNGQGAVAVLGPHRARRAVREFLLGGCSWRADFTCNRVMELAAPVRVVARLSPRQRRLLELLCDGHQYKTAAAAMGVSVNTVGFHVRRMYVRLGVHSKSEAVAKAFREDLLRWHTT